MYIYTKCIFKLFSEQHDKHLGKRQRSCYVNLIKAARNGRKETLLNTVVKLFWLSSSGRYAPAKFVMENTQKVRTYWHQFSRNLLMKHLSLYHLKVLKRHCSYFKHLVPFIQNKLPGQKMG